MRLLVDWDNPSARPFDGAQGERPHHAPGMDSGSGAGNDERGRYAEPVSKVTPRPTFHFLRLMSVPTVPITMVKNSQLGLFNGLMKHTPRTATTGRDGDERISQR